MGYVVHRIHGCAKYEEYCRIVVDAYVLGNLVISPLEEGGVITKYRACAAFGQTGGHGYSLFFCDSHIDELFSCLFSPF